jgi:Dolichyl-phosphate-mannose-protein mannosyltransferase
MNDWLTKAYTPFGRALLIIIVMAGALDVFVARSMSVTYDEPQSVAYGELILHGQPDRSDPLFNSKSPVTALNAIPRFVAGRLSRVARATSIVRTIASMRFARLASICAVLLLNLVSCRWVYSLYGALPTIAVSILVAFSPNLVAHGTLANNDAYFALGVVWALFYFRQYLLQPTLRNTVVSGASLAIAQLTKPFALYLYLVVALLLLLVTLRPGDGSPVLKKTNTVIFAAAVVVCFILVMNVGYCFDRSFTRLESYHFESGSFAHLQRVPVLRNLPIPVPYPFLEGLDMLKYHDDSGLTYGKIYLLGELRNPMDAGFRSFKSYYVVAMFFKDPIAVQILFCLGLIWIGKNRSYYEFVTGEGMLLCAALILFVWFSFFRKAQLGIRNILPVLTIELIIAGAAFVSFPAKTLKTRIVLCLLVLWACLSAISYFPNEVAYMNEWVTDRTQSYKILGDSNLDYGQEGDLVHEFIAQNPDVKLDPMTPVEGRVLVSVNPLIGDWQGYEPMYWLLRLQPIGRVGYGHLLFAVTKRDVVEYEKSQGTPR